jgi:hypothetical protein
MPKLCLTRAHSNAFQRTRDHDPNDLEREHACRMFGMDIFAKKDDKTLAIWSEDERLESQQVSD